MSNEFWLGVYYGFIAGAAVVLVPLLAWLNRRVREALLKGENRNANFH